MSGSLFADAIAAAERVVGALFVWLLLGAFVATFVTLTVCAGVAWAVEAAWRGVTGPLAASRALLAVREMQAFQDPPGARTSPRVPSWVRTEHEEAA